MTMRTFTITDDLPRGTVLLEASAGTGKTWTIAALVTRYVAEGVVTLPEMLVVTFGRAASQELRARVREQLVQAERVLATGGGPEVIGNELLGLLLDADAEELARRRSRLRAALTHFDAATIATTHQFCQQVLRSLGVAGSTDPDAQLVEDLDDLLVDVVDDLYLRGFRTSSDEPFITRAEALKIARTVVDDIHAELRPVGVERHTIADRRVRFAQAVRQELAVRKRRLQVMHYNDLLTQLADTLADPDAPARQRMRARWKVVLVDEFQDTDPVQWQVLDRAFSGHALAMVLIGDPKQAIYAFRGGDVVTYLDAAATAAQRCTLPRNFRSDGGVINALQVMLGGAELGDEQITVHPVSPHLTGSRLQGAPSSAPVRLRQVLLKEHLGGRRYVDVVRPFIAQDLAQDIAALLASGATFEGRPLRARDIAVIAHRGKDLAQAQRALHDLGIPAVSTGGSSVFATQAAVDWLALLEAMVAPHRSMLTRAAALTDLLGYGATDLDTGGGDLDDELANRCRKLAATYSREGIAAVLEVLTVQGLPARVLGRTGGERTLTDLRHIAQLLHQASRADNLGLSALLDWLRAGMAEGAPASAGARTRRLDTDSAAVQLLTIHGSKGLQFPIVYLPSLTDRWVSDSPDIPLFHEPAPERTRCLDVGGRNGNPWWDASVRAHKDEDSGESLRLLYVALTRAQSQVVTWWAPMNNAQHSPLHRILFGRQPGQAQVPEQVAVTNRDDEATHRLQAWATAGAFSWEPAHPAAQVPTVPLPPPPELAVGTWTRRIDLEWRRTSYTALSTPQDAAVTTGVGSEPEISPREDEGELASLITARDVAVAESGAAARSDQGAAALPEQGMAHAFPGADRPSPMAHLPVGATFGSLVHEVLEHADPQAPDLRAELSAQIRAALVRWPVEVDSQELATALTAVIDTPLGPLAAGTDLRRIGLADRLCELDFELPLGGGDRGIGGPSGTGDPASARGATAVLGDLAPLLQQHLPPGDPVRAWAEVLRGNEELAAQQLRGYLTGSIDVLLRTGDRYLVVDYKTNWLGRTDEPLTLAHYRPELLHAAMGHSSYPLQALLYAVVAHRFLRWRLPDYDPERHLGGVLYLYVRGMAGPDTPVVEGHPCGVFSWAPPVDLILATSDLLAGITGGNRT